MALFPTFKILVYRTVQNAIQPPSAGKNSLPHIWDCPLQSLKCSWDQVSGKEEWKPSLCKSHDCTSSYGLQQVWEQHSRQTAHRKHAFIPIKTRKDIPQMPWLASVICGTSPQHSGFSWVTSRSACFQGYPRCPPLCWPSQLCLTKHVALFLTGNYQGFLQSKPSNFTAIPCHDTTETSCPHI